jgi:hypothetical protein
MHFRFSGPMGVWWEAEILLSSIALIVIGPSSANFSKNRYNITSRGMDHEAKHGGPAVVQFTKVLNCTYCLVSGHLM